MKLFIINGENNDDKIEINIDEDSNVNDIKNKLNEILNGNFTKIYFKLVHKNSILLESGSIKYYKIFENDEIWFGKIENYLRKDDFVIVYLYIVGLKYESQNKRIYPIEYLTVNRTDTILTIKSIIERIHPKIINIWNVDGKQMRNDQIVIEIDTNENYKLIIRCDDGEGNEINNTFDECCYLYNKGFVDEYLDLDEIRGNTNEFNKPELLSIINTIKQIFESFGTSEKRLNKNLSDFPTAFLNSTNFFSRNVAIWIVDIFNDILKFKNQYDDEVVRIFRKYFDMAMRIVLAEHSILRQQTNKSLKEIAIDALNFLAKYLNDSSCDWRPWMREWMNRFLFKPLNDSDFNDMLAHKTNISKFQIKMKEKEELRNNFIKFKPDTVRSAKQTISQAYDVELKHLYCIMPGGDDKPNDEDKFDDKFIIEIVSSMKDIEILRYLDQGGYGDVLLCQDKISGNQFALKKQLGVQGDLYRDISIQCRIRNCGNIMNYLGLFNIDGNICIAMQYMSQGSIKSYLDKGKRFSENDLLKICYQILLQIRDIHKEGIIHRDIKCDNIVIDEHNNAKLIDFGLSKFTENLSNEKLLENLKAYKPGAVRFMAPEILKCEKYTNKIDIWSFGAAMIEMITGKYPYNHLNDLQAMFRIRNTGKIEFEPPESISQEFIELINLCLNKDPDERPSAEQLIQMNIFNKMK